ncbi:phage/plasmid primase, P4 family [Streptomyces sp. C1-2]|uniref:phage/plasmid primase, P4 family n=1 Tax=Streptomyces sp. C1-2 TaxID=2720022 RepID=UPI0023F849CF|nr:phage/plasmid primase, P4 family [Streptomyces sp. C1-2]
MCTPAGVVDLTTGRLRKADPQRDLHSRATSVTPHRMETPRWRTLLTDSFREDADGQKSIDYLQLMLGHSVTGEAGTLRFPFLLLDETGGVDRSVLLDTVIRILGDYAYVVPPAFLDARSFCSEHVVEPSELHGRRLIVCEASGVGGRLDERRIRLLCSDEPIKVRQASQGYCTFAPTHQLWLTGDRRSEVFLGKHTVWRRMRILPIAQTAPKGYRPDNLASELVREEGPGILQWLIEGARRVLEGREQPVGQ